MSSAVFWPSRAGGYLVAAFVLAGLMLWYERRNHIFENTLLFWMPILICVGMHFYMNGGQGGDRKHGAGGSRMTDTGSTHGWLRLVFVLSAASNSSEYGIPIKNLSDYQENVL